MLKFSDILQAEGIPKKQTWLARHSDKSGRGVYRLWIEDLSEFEKYQSLQTRVKFDVGEFVASFVLTPTDETLFVGLYEVLERTACREGTTCPVSGTLYHAGKAQWHKMKRSPKMSEYIGKLVIGWNTLNADETERRPSQMFAQGAGNEKRVIEVLREKFQIPFPGFRSFHENVSDVPNLPESWKQALRSVWGIYLLVCNATGKQYVGSAYNENGLYGRLCDYKDPQQPGHKRLVSHDKALNDGKGYQCCVLDVVTPGVTTSEITTLESLWKDKLLTREDWSLNDN